MIVIGVILVVGVVVRFVGGAAGDQEEADQGHGDEHQVYLTHKGRYGIFLN